VVFRYAVPVSIKATPWSKRFGGRASDEPVQSLAPSMRSFRAVLQ